MKNNKLEVFDEEAKIIVPHEEGKIAFVYRDCMPYDNFFEARKDMENRSLSMPTTTEAISLFYAASQDTKNHYSGEIIGTFAVDHLFTNNGLLWTNDGVYIEDNPLVADGRIQMDKTDLDNRIQNNDRTARFAPYGFKTGWQTFHEIEENPFVVGLAGMEGTSKLAKIAADKNIEVYIGGLELTSESDTVQTFPLLSSCFYCESFKIYNSGEPNKQFGTTYGLLKTIPEPDFMKYAKMLE